MNQIIEFFKGIFDTRHWPPRWHCGYWTDFHGWLFIISDLLIWLAYFLIPAIIIDYFLKRNKAIKFRKVYILFAAFILLCGTTHFVDAMMFWIPMYRLNALIRCLTAIVSLPTAFYLCKILPEAFRQPTNLELEVEISRRKEVESALQKANQNLEAFAYVASHDLQEPLRKILLYSSMLYQRNESTMDTKSKDLLRKIESSSDRLKNMTKAILNLSVLKEQVAMEIIPLPEVVNLVIADLEQSIAEKKALITVGPLPSVAGNKIYLYQLFLNLIGNAIKFTEQSPSIVISAEDAKDKIVIHIADNGIGMNADDKEKIFAAFERLPTTSTFEGSGIGLAICKRIIEIHGGRIYVESQPGKGSVFTIELPALPVA